MESKNDLLQDDDLLDDGLRISDKGSQHLSELLKWSKFLGILGMILTAIIFVMALIFGSRLEAALSGGFTRSATDGLLGLLMLVSVAIGYFIISYFLFQFASQGQTALQTLDQYEFTRATKNLKNMYLLIAITLTIYVLYTLLELVTSKSVIY